MPVYKYIKEVKNKKTGKTVQKKAYRAIGSYVDVFGQPQKYHKRGFVSEGDAKEWERQFLLNCKTIQPQSITFNELYLSYLENRKSFVKESTYYDIQYNCNKTIIPFWKKVKLSDINIAMIEKWQKELFDYTYTREGQEKHYSNNKLDQTQTQFKTIMKYGIKKGYITNAQLISFTNIKRTDEFKKEMLFWTPEEYDKFIQCVEDPFYIALFNVLYWCGLRLGEALALTWNDIDMATKTIKITKNYNGHQHVITTPKTNNSYRNVIMPLKCFESIQNAYMFSTKYDAFNNERFIFGYLKPFDDNTIRRIKNKACEEANVKQIRLHDFRHSHVSLLISLGINAFDISKRLGHTVDMVNNTYGHWFNDAQQKMVDKLNSL